MLPGKAVAPGDIHIDQGRAEGQVHILIMLMDSWGQVRDRSHCFLFYRPGFEGCIPKLATTLALRAFSTSGYALIGQSRDADTVGSAAILCLGAYRISFVLCLICFYVSTIPHLICSTSHLFHVSSVPRLTCFAIPRLTLHLICSMSHIFRGSKSFVDSQILSQLQATSWNSEPIMIDKS